MEQLTFDFPATAQEVVFDMARVVKNKANTFDKSLRKIFAFMHDQEKKIEILEEKVKYLEHQRDYPDKPFDLTR